MNDVAGLEIATGRDYRVSNRDIHRSCGILRKSLARLSCESCRQCLRLCLDANGLP